MCLLKQQIQKEENTKYKALCFAAWTVPWASSTVTYSGRTLPEWGMPVINQAPAEVLFFPVHQQAMPRGGIFLKKKGKAENPLLSSSFLPSGQSRLEWYLKAEREVRIFFFFIVSMEIEIITVIPCFVFSSWTWCLSHSHVLQVRPLPGISPGFSRAGWAEMECLGPPGVPRRRSEVVWEEAGSLEGRRKEKQVVLRLTRQMLKLLLAKSAETSRCAGE